MLYYIIVPSLLILSISAVVAAAADKIAFRNRHKTTTSDTSPTGKRARIRRSGRLKRRWRSYYNDISYYIILWYRLRLAPNSCEATARIILFYWSDNISYTAHRLGCDHKSCDFMVRCIVLYIILYITRSDCAATVSGQQALALQDFAIKCIISRVRLLRVAMFLYNNNNYCSRWNSMLSVAPKCLHEKIKIDVRFIVAEFCTPCTYDYVLLYCTVVHVHKHISIYYNNISCVKGEPTSMK